MALKVKTVLRSVLDESIEVESSAEALALAVADPDRPEFRDWSEHVKIVEAG